MASLPPRSASQRRPSPRDQASSSGSQQAGSRTDNEAYSATASPDSDQVLFDREHTLEFRPQQASARPRPSQAENDDPRRCWICFSDETEDTEDASEWRSPCPCALVAHEACLLDWVASQEAPNSRRQAGKPSKMLCPQCKSEIHLKRPRSLAVEGVRRIERMTSWMIVPGTMCILGYTVYEACFMHGVSTVYLLFGLEDGNRILAPLHQAPGTEAHRSVALAGVSRFFHNARLYLGLSAIPPVLVASRLSTFIVDSILPIVPIIFMASSSASDEMLDLGHWPPSAALTFSLLPYVRVFYNSYMEKVWGKRQRQWLKEILPRAGEEDEDEADGHVHARDQDGFVPGEEEDVFEVNIDINIMDDWVGNNEAAEQHNHPRVDGARGRAPPLDAPPLADHEVPGAAPQEPDARPAEQPRPQQLEVALYAQVTDIAETILGALVFPSIAAGMGELLSCALPKSWTTPSPVPPGFWRFSGMPKPRIGFLQSRWARSIVGGCLFVVIKDAVMLYVKWKMAQNHRKRKVLNFDKRKGRVIDA
ncbi:hypothetical protein K490DRAFT_47936 [Saccharata proteae CBS 121410]|uniref:RING-CH-type domain-containing protein n=1 Tax=Saccharata proteae CBS 121410 TaxID=1314787 RepID=A0A9P4LXI3_9PEZI|nr:hypothetical protein K490DRAFT_47936 [Saccharata proteae CBS 121410]